MLRLTIDAGNTHVKAVLFEEESVVRVWRFDSDDKWALKLLEALDDHAVDAVGAACVIPAERDVSRLAVRVSMAPAYLVVSDRRLPFRMAYRTPETLGADRLAAAAGAWVRFRAGGVPVMSIDAGTAVTTEVVDANGRFLGGSIAPGPRLQAEALMHGTARLPMTTLDAIPSVIGDATDASLQSGIFYGVIDSIRGMIRRVELELGTAPHVILTGGWAERISSLLEVPHIVDPHLVPRGILALMQIEDDGTAGS
jgi:type III pantothenate kinase